MKIAGYIFIAIGGVAFIGAASAGHSAFGPLFWLALGIVLVYFGKRKEEEKPSTKENKEIKKSNEISSIAINVNEIPVVKEEIETKSKVSSSFWEEYEMDNSDKASQLSLLLGIDFSVLSDKDVREKIGTIERLCNQYKCTIPQLKDECLKDLEQFPLSFLDHLIEMTDKEKEKESVNFNISKENTACAILVGWMKERKEFLEANNIYNKPQVEEECLDEDLSPEDIFKKKYTEILVKRIGNNTNNPLFCEGYDSPVAQELMDIMYAFLKDETEKEKANKLGYGTRYIFIITEETEKVVKKYCHAALQECIEYYNFPNQEVVTSFRCPHCGSWDVIREDYNENECVKCGYTWRAQLGYNLYLR